MNAARLIRRIASLTATLCLAAGLAPAAAQTLADGESLPAPWSPIGLSWAELPADDGGSVTGSGTLTLRVANRTAAPLTAQIQGRLDAGAGAVASLALGTVTLPAGGTVPLSVGLAAFGLDLSRMGYSGQLLASGSALTASGEETAVSPPVYFHPVTGTTGPGYVFYRDAALAATFRAGDFAGRVRDLTEPGAVTSRVVEGGSGEISGGPGAASPAQYTTCIRWQIQTTDSSHAIPFGPNAGGVEDQYLGCDGGCVVKARGVRVKVSRSGWEQTFDADPTTGCFSWSNTGTTFSVRVYGYSTDSAGNRVRIHTDPADFSSYPGQTYSILLTNVTPTNGGTNTYDVGSNVSRWTAMASLGFGIYRFHTGLANKSFHVAMDDSQCGGSSAHFGSSNSHITEGRHYLRIGNCGAGSPQTRRKFVVTHELGHTIAALYYGSDPAAVDGGEPSMSYDNPVPPNACGDGGDFYSIASKEFSSVGFREGFAHFIAARIWNDKDTEGAFHWFESDTQDLERYDNGAGASTGGRLENVCCAGGGCAASWDNAGTIEDWMRFFWDFYTNTDAGCPQQPDAGDMLNLYKKTRLNGGLTGTNYFTKMRTAAGQIGLPACLAGARFDAYAAWNGIDN